MTEELARILKEPHKDCLPCIPNFESGTPKKESWANYAVDRFVELYDRNRIYGSSFITRPDSAPWIDIPEYWDRVRDLWRGKDIVFVNGDKRSLRLDMMKEATSIREVISTTKHAYSDIDRVVEEVGLPSGPILMCLGATATALADRFARKGVHAIDLGHIGLFMRHAGSYRYVRDDLSTPGYRDILNRMHSRQDWGDDGAKHFDAVKALHEEIKPATTLDYGAGSMKLAEAFKPLGIRVQCYDPGVPGKEAPPKPCDMVICTDVLEHVEPDKLDAVLDHMRRITGMAAYLVIATRPANHKLPNGANAHLIVKPADWWLRKLAIAGWNIVKSEIDEGREVRVWTKK